MASGRHNLDFLGHSNRSIERKVFSDAMRVQISHSADKTTRQIAEQYARAWKAVSGMAAHMAKQAAEAKFSGRNLSPREIAQLDRVDRAQLALERQIRDLGRMTGITVRGGATTGIGRFTAGLLDQLDAYTGVDRHFTKPSGAAMEGLILRSTGQIESSSLALTAHTQARMKASLFRGLVLGENPDTTAHYILKETEGAFFGGLARAKTIARTEIADAHRYATKLAYNASDLVIGWKWLTALDARTCPACWALHNTFHEKTELQLSHQNCRCTQIPVLVDDDPEMTDLGDPEDLFWALPRDQQEQIMGPGRLKALEGGAPFSSLAVLKNNPGWRPAFYSTNVADLAGLAELAINKNAGDLLHIPGQSNTSILDAAFKQGGLTIQARSGAIPSSGVAVAQNDGAGIFDAREFFGPGGPALVADWMTRNGDALDSPTAHMGVWYNHADGKVYLDVVDVIGDRDQAIALGKARNQIAVFDLGTFEEIPTGGTGLGPTSEKLAVSDPDIGRGVKVIVEDRANGPIQIDARIIGHDPSKGTVTIKGQDGYIRDVKPDALVEFTSPPITKERSLAVSEVSSQAQTDTGVKVDLKGSDPVVAQQAADALRSMVAAFPDVKPANLGTATNMDTEYAITFTGPSPKTDGTSSTIGLNLNYTQDAMGYKARATEDEESGFHPQGSAATPVAFTVSHEYGHVLDNALWPKGEIDPDRQKVTEGVMRALGQPTGPQPVSVNDARNKAVEKDLSRYGSGYGPGEMFAEAVGDYMLNGPGKSIVADTIMRAVVRRYEKVWGHPPSIPHLDELMEGK